MFRLLDEVEEDYFSEQLNYFGDDADLMITEKVIFWNWIFQVWEREHKSALANAVPTVMLGLGFGFGWPQGQKAEVLEMRVHALTLDLHMDKLAKLLTIEIVISVFLQKISAQSICWIFDYKPIHFWF